MNRHLHSVALAGSLLLLALVGAAQQVINNLPIRAYGAISPTRIDTTNPNLVEGREFALPHDVAVDPASGFVYVSDAGNNRVLGFTSVLAFENGAAAALVIGQSDFNTTSVANLAQRPDQLNAPTGLAVDANGNLYVADNGNHRVLRFARPSENWAGVGTRLLPDLVIGQENLTSNTAPNPPTARSLSLPSPSSTAAGGTLNFNNPGTVGLTFDGDGNLWVTDWNNHRVLRFPASALGAGASNGPQANLVLGQADFTSRVVPPTGGTLAGRQNKLTTSFPRAVAYIPDGNLLAVADGNFRVLVYQNPSSNNQAALRILGIPTTVQINANTQAAANIISLSFGVFAAASNRIGVVDTFNNRILVYPPREQWVAEVQQFSPNANLLAGQANFGDRDANRGQGVPNSNGYSRPFAATVFQGKLLVIDTGNHRLLRQSLQAGSVDPADGVLGQANFQASAINRAEGQEVFQPTGIAFDFSSDPPHVYIADSGNHRILGYRNVQRFRSLAPADIVIGQPDLTTNVINYPGGQTDSPTQSGLSSPTDVAVDADGNLWVADAGNGRVLRFPKPDFDNPATLPQANAVLGQPNFTTRNLTVTQSTMVTPTSVAISIIGSVVVSDRSANRILVFQPPLSNGMSATRVIGQDDFVNQGSGAGGNRFNQPRGLAIDAANRLYVADFSNNRMQIFGNLDSLPSTGANAGNSITLGFGNLAISQPIDVTVDLGSGEIWLTEAGRSRVLRYPEFNQLFFNPQANFFVSTLGSGGLGAISVAVDARGFPIVGEGSNRISFYVPRVSTTNAATFFTSQPNAPSAGQPPFGHLAPNTIASAFSFVGNFDVSREIPTAAAESVPLPTELSDIEVTLDGRPLPLFFVSDSQINFFLPNDVPQSGVVLIDVRRKSNGDLLAGEFVGMAPVAPGLFTRNEQGTGQVAAVNFAGQTASGDNSAANPLIRGQVIALFGTGMGFVPGAPNDGSPVNTALSTPNAPFAVSLAGQLPPGNVEYSGFAPGFVGLWQINVRIPDNVPPGGAVPIVLIYNNSNTSQGVRNGVQGTIQTTFALR
ncbi:MAG: hypothetical protein KIT83_21530, partial [Bryobacterales bacterium]|nr:hypothetical protein [Bryobacterales bacterium]